MKDLHTLVPSQVNLEINFNSNPVKALNPLVLAFMASVRKGRGIGDAVADLGEGPAPHPLKIFFYTGHPPYLRAWMIAPSPTPPPPPPLICRSGAATEAGQKSPSPLLSNACHTGYFF